MNEKKQIIIGNATTVVNSIIVAFAGLIIGVLGAWGIKLPVDQTGLAGVIGLVVFFLFSIINAKYHNTYFNDDENTLTVDISGLTDNQVDAIQNFVDNCTVKVGNKNFNKYNDSQIEDIDPAINYEDIGDNEDDYS